MTMPFDLGLTSCDFVGDSGCCDPNCWQCHSPCGPENLRCLAKNIAAAAALCRAWRMRKADPEWWPGCHMKVTWDVYVCPSGPKSVESYAGTVEAETFEEAFTAAREKFGYDVNHVHARQEEG